MKKRSDKFIALLLCAFMAFSLIAAAADVPVEGCAECGAAEGHSVDCSQYVAPVDPEPSTEPETPADPVPSTEPETPTDPVPSTEPETPTDPVPSTEPETPAAPVPSTEPEDPVELEDASFNGDAEGMNFTVAGELPVGGKLQVEAIDASCNDYIVETYLKDVELPAGAPMAYDLTILTEDGKVYEPAAGSEFTVTMSSNDGTAIDALAAYHLPGVTAKQIAGAVKALAEAEAEAEPQAQPAAVDAQGDPIRLYEEMNVDSYDGGEKRFFHFTTDSFSTYFLVAQLAGEEKVCICEATDEEKAAEDFVHTNEACPFYEKATEDVQLTAYASDHARVTVSGNLPENATLKVQRVVLTEAELAALLGAEKAAAIKEVVAYDIKIVVDGVEFEPESFGESVTVTVNPAMLADNADVNVAHVTDEAEKAEIVEATVNESNVIEFEAESFSTYIFYTVDFHYAEGTYSIAGESSVLLSKVFAALGYTDHTAAEAVELSFTTPAYLAVEQVENDWLLTSLAPFSTDEFLTIKFSNGDEYKMWVTDAVTDWKVLGGDINSTGVGLSDRQYYIPKGTEVYFNMSSDVYPGFSIYHSGLAKSITCSDESLCNFRHWSKSSYNDYGEFSLEPTGSAGTTFTVTAARRTQPWNALEKDKTVHYRFTICEDRTVTFDPNGGSGGTTYSYYTSGSEGHMLYNGTEYGSSMNLSVPSNPTRTGYTFDGWYTAASGGSKVSGSVTVNSTDPSKTYYAHWRISSSTLKVNPNGGTWNGSTSVQSFTQNYNTTKTIPDPTRDGYTFKEWKRTGNNGTLNGTTYTFGPANGATDTLTALWEEDKVTINYQVVGPTGCGNVTPTTQTVGAVTGTPSSTAAVSSNTYKFVGWYSDAECKKLVTNNATINPAKVSGKNVAATYYAKFEMNEAGYTVNHWQQNVNDDDYTLFEPDTDNKTGIIGQNTNAVAKTYTGFTVQPFSQEPIKADGTTVVNIYYDRNTYQYTITHKEDKLLGDDNILGTDSGSAKFGAEIPVEKDSFTGFTYKEQDKDTITIGTDAAKNVATVLYTRNSHVATAAYAGSDEGATVDGSGTYPYQTEVTFTATAKPGYDLLGWFDDAGETANRLTENSTYKFSMPDKDVKYWAKTKEQAVEYKYIPVCLDTIPDGTVFGSVTPTAETVGKVTGKPSSTAAAEKDFKFIGWNTKADGTGTMLETKATLELDNRDNDGLLLGGTYYALFEYADADYKVEHYKQNLDGTYNDTPDDTDNKTGKISTDTEAEAKTYEGFTAQDFEQKKITSDDTDTVVIKYTRKEHKVSYIVENDDPAADKEVPYLYGATIEDYEPTQTNYNFDGWYTDAEYTTKWTKPDYMPDEDITVYGKFVRQTASLTISKRGMESGENAIFTVTGEGLGDGIKVSVPGNGGSITINGLFVGASYTVAEETGWSSCYTPSGTGTITLEEDGSTVNVSNSLNTSKTWLRGETSVNNEFNPIQAES